LVSTFAIFIAECKKEDRIYFRSFFFALPYLFVFAGGNPQKSFGVVHRILKERTANPVDNGFSQNTEKNDCFPMSE